MDYYVNTPKEDIMADFIAGVLDRLECKTKKGRRALLRRMEVDAAEDTRKAIDILWEEYEL